MSRGDFLMPPSIRSDNLENISKDLNKPCEEVRLRQSHCQCSSGHLTPDMITRRESPISGLFPFTFSLLQTTSLGVLHSKSIMSHYTACTGPSYELVVSLGAETWSFSYGQYCCFLNQGSGQACHPPSSEDTLCGLPPGSRG